LELGIGGIGLEEYPDTYISRQEKDIIVLRNSGIDFVAIANRLNSSVGEIEKKYRLAMDKVGILEEKPPDGAENIFPCNTISEFLDLLGIGPHITGRNELHTAIWFAYAYPETLDAINAEFFPQLARELNQPESFVSGRVRRTVRYASYDRRKTGTAAYVFFHKAGLASKHEINLKQFLTTAHQCIVELQQSDEKKQKMEETYETES